jgi:hypothetical protein
MADQTKSVDEVFRAQVETVANLDWSLSQPTDEKPSWGYPRVMNVEPISNADGTFVFWSLCSLYDIKTGAITGTFEKLALTPWGTLARLTADKPATGGDCPTGTLIILEGQQIGDFQSGSITQKLMPSFLGYEKFLPLTQK